MTALLTLDTNVLYRLWEEKVDPMRLQCVNRLLALAKTGDVDLVVTRYVIPDVPDEPYASEVRALPLLNVDIVSGLMTLDESTLDGPDMLASADFIQAVEQLRSERTGARKPKFPQPIDFDHLHAHMLHGRDVFLTWDEPIIRLASWLADHFGIVVEKPDKYLDQPH